MGVWGQTAMCRGRGALRKIVLGPKTIETKGENQVFMYILECMYVHVYSWIKEKGKRISHRTYF